ncbi:MAG: YraN family protein [Planctomycetes bacterium]|nr:YraN family protein [Planctomycetota bacterium]
MLFLPGYRRWIHADTWRFGRWGERRSEKFLKKKGLTLIARNYSCTKGELDLIMSDPSGSTGAIVFIEVKTRRSESYQKAQKSVNYRKRKKMAAAARHFLSTYKIKNKPLRFDIVAVILPKKGPLEIRHYKKAFTP